MVAEYKIPVKDSFEWQSRVLSKTISTPPSSPNLGDRYIVPSGASGVWSGQAGKIAQYNGSSWYFITPINFFTVWVEADSKLYYWSGSAWIDYASTILGSSEEAKRYALLVGS